MCQEMKLVIIENSKVIKKVVMETSTQPTDLVISLEKFQRQINAALTELIELHGDQGDAGGESADEESEEDTDMPVSPKKRKK